MTATRPAPGSNAALLRRRRRILRWSSPALILAVLAGAKLLAMSGAADVTLTAFLVGNGEFAARAADTLAVANVVEAYKAPFDAGTVAAASATTPADLRRAARLLNRALGVATADGECAVRFNLALVYEASAKAAGTDLPAAERLYRAAATVAAEAPADCADVASAAAARADAAGAAGDAGATPGDSSGPGAPGSRSAADDLSEAGARSDGEAQQAGADLAAERAKGAAAAEQAAPTDGAAPPESPSDQALSERAAKAQAQQQEAQDQQRAGTDSSSGDGEPDVATPW